MIAGMMLLAILPSGIALIFSVMQNQTIEVSKTMTNKNFTVALPNMVLIVGAMAVFTALAVMLGFTFLSDEKPLLIFYVVFGALLWLGTYLIVKTLTFKVMVRDNLITVYSAFRRPYSFTFSEIASAVRQVKDNQVKSERIVIKTTTNRKLIVERTEISYRKFVARILSEVPQERLVGF